MTLLNKLVLTCDARPAEGGDAISKGRAAVLNGIQVQRQLVAAARAGTSATLTKTVRAKDGTEAIKRLRPRKWFFHSPDGRIHLQIFHGHKPLPLNSGGMMTIVAGDLDGVDGALTVVAEAIKAGELDEALKAAQAARMPGQKNSPP